MEESFGRALLQAFKPRLKEDLPPLSMSLDIKLRLEQLRLAEFVRAARTAAGVPGDSDAAQARWTERLGSAAA